MAVKLAAVGLAAMLTAGLLSLLITWWAGPIDRAGGFPASVGSLTRFSPVVFGARHRPGRLCRVRVRPRGDRGGARARAHPAPADDGHTWLTNWHMYLTRRS